MTLAAIKNKSFQFGLLLAGYFMVGCVATPSQHAAWPWNTKNDYDMKQTGNFFAASVGVAQFGDAPKAVKPVSPEPTGLPHGENATESPFSLAKSEVKTDTFSLSSATVPSLDKKTMNSAGYDFSLKVVKVESPTYLPVDLVKHEYRVTAFNRGMAPVSLAFDIDSSSHQKWSADKLLPVYVVVPPNSELVVAQLSEKTKQDSGSIKSSYIWYLGDYNASHFSTGHYKFPFPINVKASVSMPTTGHPSSADKHSIIFVMPVNTPILAVRKGTVVRIKGSSKIDVLHDDSTIASYEHLGEINQNISVGSVVSTEDSIGIVGALGKEKEGYLRLTVWRPELTPPTSPKLGSSSQGFDIVSFPLKFCSPNFKECRELTNDQLVSRSELGGNKKKRVRGGNP